ncbi:MAG TPA: prepilin-type N-terminal cleavage/methylation domain-containing protein [Candidatus Andersenbacteria bacterium]|nr:prepilin-type N-terminal cleavage/methylation domain-containing protein [Candidatus Andersenbacteria bacterium]
MDAGNQKGFTLIESLIIISIITIMSGLALQAIPLARSDQQLISDTEQIRAVLLDAKERALNQVRPDDCLPMSDMASKDRAGCSDVGIAFSGNKLIEFADTDPDNQYISNKDYTIATFDLNTTPTTDFGGSLVYTSFPPTVYLNKKGSMTAMGPAEVAKITLISYRSLTRVLTVHPYGTIDVKSL